MKKLKDPEEPIARFFDRAKHLRSHLGAGLVPIASALAHRPPSLRTLSGSAASRGQEYCGVSGDELV